jgi:hypothetical protein
MFEFSYPKPDLLAGWDFLAQLVFKSKVVAITGSPGSGVYLAALSLLGKVAGPTPLAAFIGFADLNPEACYFMDFDPAEVVRLRVNRRDMLRAASLAVEGFDHVVLESLPVNAAWRRLVAKARALGSKLVVVDRSGTVSGVGEDLLIHVQHISWIEGTPASIFGTPLLVLRAREHGIWMDLDRNGLQPMAARVG